MSFHWNYHFSLTQQRGLELFLRLLKIDKLKKKKHIEVNTAQILFLYIWIIIVYFLNLIGLDLT